MRSVAGDEDEFSCLAHFAGFLGVWTAEQGCLGGRRRTRVVGGRLSADDAVEIVLLCNGIAFDM